MAITFYFNESKIQIFRISTETINEIIQMHAHAKNAYEIHLIDDGRGVVDTSERRYELFKNMLYVTGPNVAHKQTPDFEDPMHELCIYLKILSSDNNDSAVHFFTSRSFWIGKSNRTIREIFKQIIAENERERLWRESILSSLTIRLITEMTRLYFPDNTTALLPPENTDLNESRSWILDWLLQDDCSSVTLGDFASGLGVCPRQAERIIKDCYGASFKKLRYESKMAMAATLLEQENISVEACALRCGYASAASFTTAFKQKYEITPKAYQKRFKASK